MQGCWTPASRAPENLHAYGQPSIFELAAAYAFGVVKNHPFVDGNKRTGFTIAVMFLERNGETLPGIGSRRHHSDTGPGRG